MRSVIPLLAASTALLGSVANAATADQWKGKSIYQLITDRFAPPSDTAPARTSPLPETCDPALQTWCGGTWLSIIDKLDYIHEMGMDAIWISPTSKNIDVYTPYNYAYHGYWVLDPHELNPRFGSEEDLHALVEAVHARGMYIMVDIVVNNIPSLTTSEYLDPAALQAAGSFWTQTDYFHHQCWIDYSNMTSVQQCWLGDDKLPLMDVNTEHPDVISGLESWIGNFVSTYNIDGLRIDAAKHVGPAFWPGFCKAAGVFCIGEVYGDDLGYAASYQIDNVMDSVLGFPLYYGITAGFGQPMGNMSHFVDIANQVLQQFPRPELLGNFIENHDLPRWRNTTVDPQLAYNAIVAQFVFEGLPVVYYGQEQDFASGAHDPENRQALWPSNYDNTTTYQRIAKLNQVRHGLIANGTTFNGQSFLDHKTEIIASTQYDVAIRKGPLLAVLTNRGSPSQDATFGVNNIGWNTKTTLVDVLSCRTFIVMDNQSISISYAGAGAGGMPYLFLTTADATSLGICGLGGGLNVATAGTDTKSSTSDAASSSGGGSTSGSSGGSSRNTGSAALSQVAPHPAVVGAGVLVLVVAGAFGRRFA